MVVWVIKTFNDLRFRTRDSLKNRTAEIKDFGNGYGIEVEEHLSGYDVTILKDGEMYTKTYIANDVLARLTAEEVADVMKKVQNLVKFTY
jgi:hypothetical protein